MNKKLCTIASMILASVTAFGQLQTAKVQIIHNSPDQAARSVDIFVNGNEALSDVDYQSATGFIDLPAGIALNIGIAPASQSNSVADTVKNFPLTLTANENYYVVADGLLSSNFGLNIMPGAMLTARDGRGNAFVVYHGSVDAPAVDALVEEANTNVAEDLAFGSFSNYAEVANADYNVQVRNETSTATVAAYEAPLAALNLDGQSLVVMASGYLSPAAGDSAFSLLAVLSDGTVQELPTANSRAQIIHNSEAAGTVDIWVNNAKALEGVEYRTATGYIDLPVGLNQTVAITAAGAADTTGAPINASLDLLGSQTYIVVADGDASNQGLGLNVMMDARETATSGQGNDFVVYHGSVDAPAVDAFVEEANTNVAEDLAFGSFSNYAEVANADYNVQVRNETSTATVAAYEAPLAALNLDGQSLVVMASGYLSPAAGDSAFSLFAVLSDGTVQELPTANSRAQIIHNSEAAGTVDVWVNNSKALEGVEYRTATGYIDLPVGLNQTVAITGAGAADTTGAPINASLDLLGSQTYIVVADGDASNQGLGLNVMMDARETATSGQGNDFVVYHGSVDAPAVDAFVEEANTNVAEDLAFGSFSNYAEVANADYNVQVRNETSTATVAAYEAPLAALNLDGQSLVVMASGYLSPASGDSAFSLFAVLSDGTVQELPTANSRAQIIHNSEVAGTVDVWVNNALTLEDVEFRTSTAYLDLPVGLNQSVAITAANAVDTTGAAIQASLDLEGSKTYVVVADGDVANQPLGLNVYDMAREAATSGANNTDVLIYHGGSNAPTVDVVESDLNLTLSDDLSFGQFEAYNELSTANYQVAITTDDQVTTVATYNAALADLQLEGQSIVVIASGYLNPGQDEPAFGLFAAVANGGALVPLQELTVSTEDFENVAFNVFPNPVNDQLQIIIDDNIVYNVEIIDITGKQVYNGQVQNNSIVDMSNLDSGNYLVRLVNENNQKVVRVVKK